MVVLGVVGAVGALMGVAAFLAQSAHWRVLADLALLALFAGLYSVPMYALIQVRSEPSHRARIIAANNILNAIFMVASSLIVGVLLSNGLSVPQVFLCVSVANAVVAAYIFLLVPEYLLRFVALVITRCLYRFRVEGTEHIPSQGAAILVSNHVSYVDAVLLLAASPRPVRFIMDHRIFATPILGRLFRLGKAIPIAPQAEDPAAYARAFDQARAVLAEGDLICIFPEGGLTRDGTLGEFKPGVMKLLQTNPVPVVPLALINLWGSFFSRVNGAAMTHPLRRGLWSRVGLRAGVPMPAAEVTPQALRQRVAELLAQG